MLFKSTFAFSLYALAEAAYERTVLAGTGTAGLADGWAVTNSTFNNPYAIALDTTTNPDRVLVGSMGASLAIERAIRLESPYYPVSTVSTSSGSAYLATQIIAMAIDGANSGSHYTMDATNVHRVSSSGVKSSRVHAVTTPVDMSVSPSGDFIVLIDGTTAFYKLATALDANAVTQTPASGVTTITKQAILVTSDTELWAHSSGSIEQCAFSGVMSDIVCTTRTGLLATTGLVDADGTTARLGDGVKTGMALDAGKGLLYFTDYSAKKIRTLKTTTPYTVATLATNFTTTSGPAKIALEVIQGVKNLYVTEFAGHQMSKIALPNAATGDVCATGNDCVSDICTSSLCVAQSAVGALCSVDANCASNRCYQGVCVAPSCDDRIKNGDETDVDCGGACVTNYGQSCQVAGRCLVNADCQPGNTCQSNSFWTNKCWQAPVVVASTTAGAVATTSSKPAATESVAAGGRPELTAAVALIPFLVALFL